MAKVSIPPSKSSVLFACYVNLYTLHTCGINLGKGCMNSFRKIKDASLYVFLGWQLVAM
jgi:hypothetical protein